MPNLTLVPTPTTSSDDAPESTVTSIPFDQCICGTQRKHPRGDCWAETHDCKSKS